ncbi:MAG: hypothetical protein ACLFWL_05240 [Candidatus Brocadiia bacterium]
MAPEQTRAAWSVTGKLAPGEDDILGSKTYDVLARARLALRSVQDFSGAYTVEALVRFPAASGRRGRSGNAKLRCGVTREGKKVSWDCQLFTACVGRAGFRASAQLKPHIFSSLNNGLPHPFRRNVTARERFSADKISPVWREPFRIEVENGMAALPPAKELWRRMRIEIRPGAVRFFLDGFLVAACDDTGDVKGKVDLIVTGEARVASIEVQKLEQEEEPFIPVPLDSVCNATGPVDLASLPSAGQVAVAEGIPFVFPHKMSRGDHVDVGQSLFRYRMERGYRPAAQPRSTWPDPARLDPARIMLRVPNKTYRRLWIVAASDGEPNSTPVLTVRFFRVARGWGLDSVARVPEFTARTAAEDARRIPVKMKDGTEGNLWLLPVEIDPFALSSDFRNEKLLHIELTKEIKDFRAFPDPCNYGSFQAGLPSAVRVYALTLEKAPISVIASCPRAGNTYTHPERPKWAVTATNQTDRACTANIQVKIRGPQTAGQNFEKSDTDHTRRTTLSIPAGGRTRAEFDLPVPAWGLQRISTSVSCADLTQTREGTYLVLPPDERKENAKTSRWGLWCWMGAHGTNPNVDDNLRLLYQLGARTGGRGNHKDRKRWGIGPDAILAQRGTASFATENPHDPEEYKKYSETFGQKVAGLKEKTPDLEYISIFAEHSISLRVTHGPPCYAWGEEEWWEYNEKEKARIRSHTLAAKAAFEGVRKYAPKVKVCFGHCAPQFGIPFMRKNFPKELFDAFGMDSPQFERMPERPPRAVEPNLLYFMDQEMKNWGYEGKERVHLESYFPSSHRLALGHRVAADHIVRTAVLSLALGSDRFLSCWSLHDCEDYWGTQHYGCVGLIGRGPEFNPKPGAAAFATMTQLLDSCQYDGWLPTGSRSVYCVRFKGPKRRVYCLWTVRGRRSITLDATPETELTVLDENSNEIPDPPVLTPTPVWIIARGGKIKSARVNPAGKAGGTPASSEKSSPHRIPLENFENFHWTSSSKPYPRFAENHWDVRRYSATMDSETVISSQRDGSKVWRLTLNEAPKKKPFVGWYQVFTPPKPILIPGRAEALGIWANGNSGWGRIVYEVVDAKGETYLSCGTKDAWNCDDVHSWSYFNFDGWRYMEFPLPSNEPGDNYRDADYVWWGHDGEGIVDLPLKLSKIIIEMPTHQIYVDQVLPVDNLKIELDDLIAVYGSAKMMTEAPIKIQRAAARTQKIEARGTILSNPLEDLKKNGIGNPTKIVKLYPPEERHDGTRVHVSIEPVGGAKQYQVWVSAYPDGRGAQILARTKDTEPLVRRLRPSVPFYFFVTYKDADGKTSKPSPARKTVLKDEFPMK